MDNDENENQNMFNSQNITTVKILDENFTNSLRESRKGYAEGIYNEVDEIFFENIDEYTNDPCKLITKVAEKYKNEFKNWPYLLHSGSVEHGDLVRMRGMILNGMQPVFSLNASITEEKNGDARTVCGILRNRINCSNIKETKGITRRNAYILVPEKGITDWYFETFCDENHRRFSEVHSENKELRTYALFYGDETENFKPNVVLDLYGILDLEMEVEEDVDGPNEKSPRNMISLHVIHYELLEHHNIVLLAHPEKYIQYYNPSEKNFQLLKCKNILGFESLIYAFEQFFENRNIAQSLACQLFISRHSQPPKSVEYVFPYTIKRIYDSKLIIEMIKLFMPKVHIIEVTQKTIEESWASYERPESGFEQGLLQVSDNTLIIIDETKSSPESLLRTKKGRENCALIRNFLSNRKIPFIYPYQTVEVESSINVLVLSGEKCFFGQEDFAMVAPKSCPKDINFIQQYALKHESELDLSRHAVLCCSKNFPDVNICKAVEEMAVENFMNMQHICRNADDNSAKLHRQLIISKLLTALKGEKTVDKDCWTKAVEFENELRITVGSPLD